MWYCYCNRSTCVSLEWCGGGVVFLCLCLSSVSQAALAVMMSVCVSLFVDEGAVGMEDRCSTL